jgi:hypothetical protein
MILTKSSNHFGKHHNAVSISCWYLIDGPDIMELNFVVVGINIGFDNAMPCLIYFLYYVDCCRIIGIEQCVHIECILSLCSLAHRPRQT